MYLQSCRRFHLIFSCNHSRHLTYNFLTHTPTLTPATPVFPTRRHRSNDPIIFNERYVPNYGGPRRQHWLRDSSSIPPSSILTPPPQAAAANNKIPTLAVSNGFTPSFGVGAGVRTPASNFEQSFYKIQLAAARLVAIQEKAKNKGSLSAEDNKIYADSLNELGQAAQSLAQMQQTGQIQDFSLLFQPTVGLMPQKQPTQAPSDTNTAMSGSSSTLFGEQKGEETTAQQLGEDDLLPPNTDDPYEDVNDSVAVTAPKKDASVAEAKPVGLSIAGEGGVASSKPNAVALSGRNGLAVSAPKATAIAGVSPEEAAAFSISLPSRNHQLVLKYGAPPVVLPNHHAFDDYDYADLAPVRSVTHEMPLRANPAGGNKIHVLAQSKASSGDAFVNKWKTLVAEDFAADPAVHQPKVRVPSKFRQF